MIKLENAGLRAQRKMSLGSGLNSQKRIRAPVSKMVGLRAPQQKFQGSRAPGTPPLGPCFVNSTFPSKADFPQKSNSTYGKKNKIKSLRNCQEDYRETAPYLEQPGHHCLHLLKNNTSCTINLFSDLASRQMKTKLFFSSQAGKQT